MPDVIMLEILIVSEPPPVSVKAPMLMELEIVLAAELFTVSAPEPVNAPKLMMPLPLFRELVPLTVVAPKLIALLVVFTVPFKVRVPAVLTKPFVKFRMELPLPSVTPKVLLNVVAVVIVLVPDPSKLTA